MTGCRLENISKTFTLDGRSIRALNGICLDIPEGDFISIVGYSGCGKSTLLKTIIGLVKADQGRLRFQGMHGRMSIVFQEPRLIASKSAEKNMALALKHQKDSRVKRRILDETLEILGLTAFRNALPWQLSGGMQQRIALGRALCRQPELLLMDEPFGALDALNRSRLQQELVHIYLQRGITIVFVTHDVGEAVALGKRVLVMEDGRIGKELPVQLPYPRNKNTHEFISIQKEVLVSIVSRNVPLYQYG